MTTRQIIDHLARIVDPTGHVAQYLDGSSFYRDPASTRYHRNYDGGLAEHTLGVILWALDLAPLMAPQVNPHEVVLAALMHDTCKVGTYKVSTRNVKDPRTGAWNQIPYYEHQAVALPLGHGDASLFHLASLIGVDRVTKPVALAIRWHMSAFQASAGEEMGRLSDAMAAEPLVIVIQAADLMDTYHGLAGDVLPKAALDALQRASLIPEETL